MSFDTVLKTSTSSLLLLFAVFNPLVATGQSVDTLRVSVQGAIEMALEVSPEVAERSAKTEFASARAAQARATRFLSEFSLTTAHAAAPGLTNPNGVDTDQLYLDPDVRNDWTTFRPFTQAEATVIQPLFTWGELSSSISAAESAVRLEQASTNEKATEVAARTAVLYYDLLLTDALRRLTTEAGSIVNQAISEIRRLLDEGAEGVDDADLFQVLITEQEFNRRVVEVDEKRTTARAALRRQLFLPDEIVVEARDDVLEMIPFELDSLDAYQDYARVHRPELAQGEAGLAARSALVSVARSNLYPKLFAGATYSVAYTSGRYRQPNPFIGDRLRGQTFEAGVGLRQNLNFAQTKAKIRQAEAERDQVRYQLDAGRQLILFEVEKAYRDVRVARSAVLAQEEALRLSREWLQTETINFDLDLGDTENLVKAVQANLNLQATTHEAVRNFNVSVIELLKSTGMLIAAMTNGTLVDQQ
ncbi:MAG: TolC family protein [Rhodothermales bacterium]|nr:TolC family protein [Rhodothermales bacterium]